MPWGHARRQRLKAEAASAQAAADRILLSDALAPYAEPFWLDDDEAVESAAADPVLP